VSCRNVYGIYGWFCGKKLIEYNCYALVDEYTGTGKHHKLWKRARDVGIRIKLKPVIIDDSAPSYGL
jgi:hypothetical protein